MTTTVTFEASNNADWVRGFSLVRPAVGPLPWANVVQWSGEGEYQASSPASIVVHDDDLYLARGPSDPTDGEWKEDEWLLIGSAEAWSVAPLDLTGAEVEMTLVPQRADGTADLDRPTLTLTTRDGTLELTSPSQGGVEINLRAARARGLAAQTYVFDILVKRDVDTIRPLAGDVVIHQGITR